MSQQALTRKGLHEKFSADPKAMYEEAMEKKLTLPSLFREKIDDELEKSEDRKLDPLNWMLRKEGLSIRSVDGYASSSIEDFMANDATKQLFWSVLDNDYDQNFGFDELGKVAADGTLTDSGLTDNTPFKVRYTTPMAELQRFSPRVRVVDIVGSVETIPGTTFQQPELRGDPATTAEGRQAAEQSRDIGEAGRIPTTTLRVGTSTGQTKKIGEGLRISTEATFSEMYMESVRIWVRRLAMRDEIRMVNEGIDILRRVAETQGTPASNSLTATPSLDDVIRVNLYSTGAYDYNLLIANQGNAHLWIAANVRSGWGTTPANFYPADMPGDRFGSVFPGVQLVNSVYAPTRLAVVNDGEGGLAARPTGTHLIGVDQRFALSLKRTARGMVDEEIYDARHQVRERYITQRYGYHLVDVEAVKYWRLA